MKNRIFGFEFYTPEVRRLLGSFALSQFVFFVTSICIIITNDRLPDRQKYPPLPDVALDNLPFIKWASKASEYFMLSMFILGMFRALTNSLRFVILYRYFLLVSMIYLLRCVCILVTSIPVPDPMKECEAIRNSTAWSKLYRAIVVHSALGFKTFGMKTCGDYIFSGHTAVITMTNMFNIYYPGKYQSFVCCLSWFINIMAVLFILLCRGHYSIDITVAFLLTVSLFSIYHLALKSKDDFKPNCTTFCGTCAKILLWLEPNSDEEILVQHNGQKYNL